MLSDSYVLIDLCICFHFACKYLSRIFSATFFSVTGVVTMMPHAIFSLAGVVTMMPHATFTHTEALGVPHDTPSSTFDFFSGRSFAFPWLTLIQKAHKAIVNDADLKGR